MTRLLGIFRRLIKIVIWSAITVLVITAGVLAVFRWRAEQREVRLAEDFAPVTGHFIQTTSGKIFAQDSGPSNGVAILLVHDAGTWSESWQPTMKALANAGFHAIAIDLPPFGYSQRTAEMDYSKAAQGHRIINVLDALNIKRAVLVGHSYGAAAIAETAMQVPERIIKLVIVDGRLSVHDKNAVAEVSTLQSAIKAGVHSVPIRNSVVATFVTNPFFTKTLLQNFVDGPRGVTPEYVETCQQPLIIKGGTEAVSAWLSELIDPSKASHSEDSSQYQQLKLPVTLIWGEVDSITSLKQAEHLRSLIAGSNLVVLEGAGHVPQVETSDAFNVALLDALKPVSIANGKASK